MIIPMRFGAIEYLNTADKSDPENRLRVLTWRRGAFARCVRYDITSLRGSIEYYGRKGWRKMSDLEALMIIVAGIVALSGVAGLMGLLVALMLR